jgi:TolB-like protein
VRDIALAANGDPSRRLASAAELWRRVLSLEQRRSEQVLLIQARERAEHETRRRAEARARRPWLVLAGVTALILAAAILNLYRRPAAAPVKTIAVLPFENIASDSSIDFLRLALPDEIATILSRMPGVAVRPTATTGNDDVSLDAQEAGRLMHAANVVTGRFVRAGEQLRITLEATDVESNRVVWRDTVEPPADSLIATQIQLALRVREGLARSLGVVVTGSTASPKDEEAYRLFLRSTALPFDPSHSTEAIALLEKSLELDPSYVPAWHAVGRRYYGELRYGGNPAMEEKWESAANRLMALDPGNVPATAGYVRLFVERGELPKAYRQAQDLVRSHPDSVDAHFTLSYVFRFAGLLQESAERCETALVLDARTQTSGLRSCAIAFIRLADYPRALNFAYLDFGSGFAKAMLIDVFVRQGKSGEALRVGSPHLPGWTSYDMLLACVQRKHQDEIRELARSVRPSGDPEANYLFAAHLSYCGLKDAALEMLRTAIEGNYCSYPALDSDPLFEAVRAMPEFVAIREAARTCQMEFLKQSGHAG